MVRIQRVYGCEILDSRGNPTVSATVQLSDGTMGTAAAPSGASTGKFEAVELRDGDQRRYGGKGVLKAVRNVTEIISPALEKVPSLTVREIDQVLQKLDGPQQGPSGGKRDPGGISGGGPGYRRSLPHAPVPVFGRSRRLSAAPAHDEHPQRRRPCREQYRHPGVYDCARGGPQLPGGPALVRGDYPHPGRMLRERGLSTGVGDEGGFAPDLESDEAAIQAVLAAIDKAGYSGKVQLALDAAGSEWVQGNRYRLPKRGKELDTEDLIEYWEGLVSKYPILSIEDPLGEEDFSGWAELTRRLGSKVQLVGDDLFVTNLERLRQGIDEGAGNAILIKPNQIGTLTETLDCIELAKRSGYRTIISHRSGETEDTFIADLAVGVNAGQIKTGAPCRTERVAKYNRLLRIEECG